MSGDEDDYLFDPSGTPDPEVVRLERLLGPMRYVHKPIAIAKRAAPRSRASIYVALSMAAAFAAMLFGGAWDAVHRARDASTTTTKVIAEDATEISGELASSTIHPGKWLETRARSARLSIEGLGTIDVDPGARVRFAERVDPGKERRLELARGTIHAKVDAPPRFFVVDTPTAVAVDLGCAYTLSVDDAGTTLHVTFGYVALEAGARSSVVPAGASCLTRKGVGPGAPFWDDATDAFKAALARADFGGDEGALSTVLREARARDALTLFSLLRRASSTTRPIVYARLAELAPPPPESAEGALDDDAIDAWKTRAEATW